MKRRMVLMLCAVATFVVAIGFVKFRQIEAAVAQASAFRPPPEAVTTIIAQQEIWQPTLGSIGTVAAVKGVTLTADSPGIVEKIAFDSGEAVLAGEVLVQLDARQEQAQLEAAEAKRDLARLSLDRLRGLLEKGVSSQAEFDSAVATFDQAQASVGEVRATIARKTIRAPFSGILGIRQVNLGQYLKSGDPVVPLQSLDPIYVNFGVPQQSVGQVRAGGEIRVSAEGVPDAERTGKITAIDSIVDESTRNLQVQATLGNRDGKLRPGMFVQAQVALDARVPVIPVPASAISYAPYGDSVFIVEDIKGPKGETYRGVRQQMVKLGSARGDQIAVVSGLKPGEEIVTSGAFKLRKGSAVQVNNETRPGNDPAPQPEDN